MLAILHAQLLKLKHNPVLFLMMFGLTVIFTLALGAGHSGSWTVHTFSEDGMSEAETAEWLSLLNRSDTFEFVEKDKASALSQVATGKTAFALMLMQDDYRVIGVERSADVLALDQHVRKIYERERLIAQLERDEGQKGVRTEIEHRLNTPTIQLTATTVGTDDHTANFRYDARTQSVFGFALFFAIFTSSMSIGAVLEERRNRIWDRMVLSSLSKTAMYSGHLLNSFLIGFAQIALVFVLFRFVFSFPLGDSLGTVLVIAALYMFAIVSLGMLLAGLVRTPQQLNVLIPLVAASSAMIGGAFWPIEIVTHPVLIALSKIFPTTYGMEALKGIAYYGHGWAELKMPAAALLLFGILCMGIGINLVERTEKKV